MIMCEELMKEIENALKIHYYFIQIAHIIRQLLDNGSIILREMKFKTKKEVSSHILTMLTSNTLNLDEVDLNFQLRFTIYHKSSLKSLFFLKIFLTCKIVFLALAKLRRKNQIKLLK